VISVKKSITILVETFFLYKKIGSPLPFVKPLDLTSETFMRSKVGLILVREFQFFQLLYYRYRLGQSYLSQISRLSCQMFDEKGRRLTKLIEEKYSYQNPDTFYTDHFHLPTPLPIYWFSLTHTLLSFLHMHPPIICVIICFGRIMIDIIVL